MRIKFVSLARPRVLWHLSVIITLVLTLASGVLVPKGTNIVSADTSNTLDVEVGEATKLVFTIQPGGASGGSDLSTQPEVSVEDALGKT